MSLSSVTGDLEVSVDTCGSQSSLLTWEEEISQISVCLSLTSAGSPDVTLGFIL